MFMFVLHCCFMLHSGWEGRINLAFTTRHFQLLINGFQPLEARSSKPEVSTHQKIVYVLLTKIRERK